jgi:large subunit ribosomal protein L9
MKVILNEDVTNLGEEGDVREVADGYGRNYLIPKKLAVLESKANMKMFDSRRETIEKRKEEKRTTAKSLRERLEAEPFTIQRSAGDTGRLFGGVTNAAVAEELEKNGIKVERKRIELPEHTLKTIGTFNVRIKLYDKEVAKLKLIIQGLNKDGEVIQQEEIASKRKEEEALQAAAQEEAKAAEETQDETAAGGTDQAVVEEPVAAEKTKASDETEESASEASAEADTADNDATE